MFGVGGTTLQNDPFLSRLSLLFCPRYTSRGRPEDIRNVRSLGSQETVQLFEPRNLNPFLALGIIAP